MLFDIFKVKYKEGIPIINDLYSDKDIINVYNNEKHSTDEIAFYLSNLSKNDKILEIGAGNGRILIPLLEGGLDIYGIEPSKNMISKIKSSAIRARISNITLEEFLESKQTIFKEIIIPATSISLFSPTEIKAFIQKYLRNIPYNKFKLIFDFIDPKELKEQSGKIQSYKDVNYIVYSANYISDDKIYYNIYIDNGKKEKLSTSTKYIYDEDVIANILKDFSVDIYREKVGTIIRMVVTIRK